MEKFRCIRSLIVLAWLFYLTYVIYNIRDISTLSLNGKVNSKEVSSESIRKVLIDDPDIVIDAINQFQKNETNKKKKMIDSNIKKYWKDIQENTMDGVAGSSDPKVKVVVFYDYLCGYCSAMSAIYDKIIENDDSVQFIFKNIPYFSDKSKLRSLASTAAAITDKSKFYEFHKNLIEKSNDLSDEKSIFAFAEKIGFSKEEFIRNFNDKDTMDHVMNNFHLFRNIGMNGIPAYIINGKHFSGMIGYDDFISYINEAK